ncbi:hypothetical protein L211DRAFT_105041 [Terfezia boudieri ATCC MYA-4762]|uniref:Uncharacterized protein n=1 Tax=Terfezia boudieri ATCC MYA-4762 TaxID=1051890 RepID=A0A3N4M4K3_9PEZI|nr:hypothetical protein L211DRAFT_105041 [Terfezia boudieri ATCC MYA-4762]
MICFNAYPVVDFFAPTINTIFSCVTEIQSTATNSCLIVYQNNLFLPLQTDPPSCLLLKIYQYRTDNTEGQVTRFSLLEIGTSFYWISFDFKISHYPLINRLLGSLHLFSSMLYQNPINKTTLTSSSRTPNLFSASRIFIFKYKIFCFEFLGLSFGD